MSLRFAYRDEKRLREAIEEYITTNGITLAERWVNELVHKDIAGGHEEWAFISSLEGLDDVTIERRFQALDILPFIYRFPALLGLKQGDILYERAELEKLEKEGDPSGFSKIIRTKVQRLEREVQGIKELMDCIDEGKELTTGIRHFSHSMGAENIRHAHAKRIVKAKGAVSTIQDLTYLNDCALMDINAFPKTHEEFKTYIRFYSSLCYAFGVKAYDNRNYNRDTGYVPLSEKAFDKFIAKIMASFETGDYKKIDMAGKENDLYNLKDSLRWLIKNVADPLLHEVYSQGRTQDFDEDTMLYETNIAACAFYGGCTAVDLARFNVFFHKNLARVSRDLREYDNRMGEKVIEAWAEKYPMADDRNLPELGQYRIVPLLTRSDLDRHHEVLGGICINEFPYPSNAIKGKSFCFSVQDKFGVICSAFELNQNGDLVQHEGYEGATPEEDQKAAVQTYVEALRSGEIKENPLYATWTKKAKDFTHVEIYGHTENDPDRARLALKSLRSIPGLPRGIKKILDDHVNWRAGEMRNSLLYKRAPTLGV